MADKNVTITDIARLAGVSKKSVSRVINNEAGVSEKTREHITAIMRDANYIPDRRARALAGGGSYILALAYNNRNSAYVLDLLQGALDVANSAGYEIILHPVSSSSGGAPAELLQLMQRSGADGLILTPPLSESFHMFESFQKLTQPIVRIAGDDVESKIPQICFDDRAAASAITTHLLNLGHRKIAFVGGPEDGGPTRRRYSGFRDALAAQNLTVVPEWVSNGDFTFVSGINVGLELLKGPNPPEAIMCCNDEMAAGVIHAGRSYGMRTPDDISITGFDDSPIAQQVWPPLSTVRQPLKEMGAAAARHLIGAIEKRETGSNLASFSHLVVERSSASRREG